MSQEILFRKDPQVPPGPLCRKAWPHRYPQCAHRSKRVAVRQPDQFRPTPMKHRTKELEFESDSGEHQ